MSEAGDRTGGIQVIARAASLLRELGEHPGGLSLAEMAGRVGLARSTVQRIIQALEAEGLVALSDQGYGFQLGPALGTLLAKRQIDVLAELRPVIADLCHETGETILLCAIRGGQLVVLDCAVAEHPLRVVYPLGPLPFPVEDLAAGRAILAQMAQDDARYIIGHDFAATEALQDHAEDALETYPGLGSIAVALESPQGLFAICAVLPSARMEIRAASVTAALKRARNAVEARFTATDLA